MKKQYTFLNICLLLYLVLGAFTLKSQNTSLPVGAIEGMADVSLNGMANYSIPIKVVPGTKNIQPNLAIVYNSAGGMGVLGMKWDISGISSITRVSQSLYHDRNVTGVKLDIFDRFAWDGNRLIVSGLGGYGANGTVYGTETETFAKITSHGNSGTGPEYFTVITQDGTIIEYGNTSDSRQTLGSNVLTWFINKITDPDGNYMSFFYLNEQGRNTLISSIVYTGNASAGLTPYASVLFHYVNNTVEENDIYIGGEVLKQNRILASIDIKYNTTLVKKYEFKYDQTRRTQLTEIKFSGENNTSINPTRITWGEPQPPFTEQSVSIECDSNIVTGDFNGDGISDYVLYNLNIQGDIATWRMYQGTGDGNFMFICEDTHKPSPPLCTAIDVEGDGKNELLFGEEHSGTKTYRYIAFENEIPQSIEIHSGSDIAYALPGDFNGDGKSDVLFVENETYRISFWGLTPTHPDFNLGSPIQITPVNHSGAGKNNIQTLWASPGMPKPRVDIYEYSDNSWPSIDISFYNGEFPTDAQEVYYGDFNGDGKQDILAYYKNTWQIYMATGNGYSDTPISAPSLPHSVIGYHNSTPILIDLNGDGKDDILQFSTMLIPPLPKTTLTVYFSEGISNSEFRYSVEDYLLPDYHNATSIKSYFGDFNGDGKTDILCKEPGNPEARIIYMFQDDQFDLVQKITDGMGVETEWEYALPSSSFLSHDDVHRKRVAWPLVKTMRKSNGIGASKHIVSYRYTNVNFDNVRRQFMGFENIYITHNGLTSRYEFVFNSLVRSMSLYRISNYRDANPSDLIGEEANLYRHIDFGNKRFFSYKESSVARKYQEGTRTQMLTTLRNDGYPQSQVVEQYDALSGGNRITSETTSYSYTSVQLTNGVQVLRPYSVTNISSMMSSVHSLSTVTKYGYDANGRLSSTRFSNTEFPDEGSISLTGNYNALGLPLARSITDGNQTRTETLVYDPTGRFIIEHYNPLNQKSSRTYNEKTGNLLSETDINGLTTEFIYDDLGRETTVIYPDNTREENLLFWIDASAIGSAIPNAKFFHQTITTGFSPVKTYYDMLGRELCHEENGYYSDTRYNAKGQTEAVSLPYTPIQTSDANKRWNRTYYDEYGRVTIENSPDKSLVYTYTPGKISVRDGVRHTTSYKTYDAAGRLTLAADTGGVIAYDYGYEVYNGKVMEETRVHSTGATVSYISDFKGNRVSLTDPNAGTMTWHYNLFDEVISQQSANGIAVNIQYDPLGRVSQKNYSKDGAITTITYEYDFYTSYNRGKGQLSCVRRNGLIDERYSYDELGRLSNSEKYIDGNSFVHAYDYNTNGLIDILGYPDNFKIKHIYDANGELNEIRRVDNNSLIYSIQGRNQYRQPTQCLYGNHLERLHLYDALGRITQIRTFVNADACLQQIDYDYDSRGRLTSRYRQTPVTGHNQREFFTYDPSDRLRSYRVNYTGTEYFFTYDNSGNITSHPHIGDYTYGQGNNLPHAVTRIKTNSAGAATIPSEELCVSYNEFNRPAVISEGIYSYTLSYGADGHRNRSITYKNGNPYRSKYYISDLYEIVQDSAGNYRHLNYIYAENSIVAILEKGEVSESGTMYYVHTDHLGSFSLITDADRHIVERYHFDAWGNRKLYENGDLPDTNTNFLFDRGFCGHEHLDIFGIINMNARLYDPVIGRFFSPDPFIQQPDFSQSFNRYSYCWNNPLTYTDPSGEFIFSALLAPIGLAPLGVIIDGACWGAAIDAVMQGIFIATGVQQGFNWAQLGGAAISGAVFSGFSVFAPSFTVASTSFATNLPKYLGKAGYYALASAASTGAGMLGTDWLDNRKIDYSLGDYAKAMGISAVIGGAVSFAGSMYDYATWDRLSTSDKINKLNRSFPDANNQIIFDEFSPAAYFDGNDICIPKENLYNKRYAYATTRHELRHRYDYGIDPNIATRVTEANAFRRQLSYHGNSASNYRKIINAYYFHPNYKFSKSIMPPINPLNFWFSIF